MLGLNPGLVWSDCFCCCMLGRWNTGEFIEFDGRCVRESMTLGIVLRSHAGGYLVYQDKLDAALKCQARGRLKKERVSLVTGDHVELEELEPRSGTAVITRRLPRQNLLSRPQLANVNQVLIVQALHQPEWNPLLCDRYIVHFQLELPSCLPILCFNKYDLAQSTETEAVRSIYERLGYFVLILSAKSGEGIERLANILSGKISVLAGPSGVGKSSLLNYLEPSLHLKVGIVEDEYGVARHTTTYSELYRIGMNSLTLGSERSRAATWVADTPGFNLAELKHPQPAEVFWQFPEIAALSGQCKFSNCLHLVEQGCNVIANLSTRTKQQRNEVLGEAVPNLAFKRAEEPMEKADGASIRSNEAPEEGGVAKSGGMTKKCRSGSSEYNTERSVYTRGGGKGTKKRKSSEQAWQEAKATTVAGADLMSVMRSERGQCAEVEWSETGALTTKPLNKVSLPRYESYCVIVREAQAEYKARKNISQKVEANVKVVGGRQNKGRLVPRLSTKHRAASRRTEKQQVSQDMDLEAN